MTRTTTPSGWPSNRNVAGTQLVATTTNNYDYLQRLTSIAHTKGSSTLASYAFTYDDRSRITAIDDVSAISSWNETHSYTYDDTDQLTASELGAVWSDPTSPNRPQTCLGFAL